jgi:predicted alpha/beta superfamily hydrolase
MKIKTRFALIMSVIYFLLLSIQARTQNSSIQYGSLYSNILKEQRSIKVILPKKYNSSLTDRFDVLYVLDGEWNTSLVEKVYEFLEYAKFIPPNIIIVSVPNYYKNGINMRDRDFTPTSTENSDRKFAWMKSSLISGGASNFLLFLKEELVPFVNRKYRAKIENNIFYGTSSGGLFAIYAYLHEPTLFKSYLTVEPSLWWDKEYINKIASEKLENKEGIRNTLWISSRDGSAQVEMGISSFDSLLTLKAADDLQWKVEAYPNETHFSAIWKGIYDGLKFTYVKSKTDGTLVNMQTLATSLD